MNILVRIFVIKNHIIKLFSMWMIFNIWLALRIMKQPMKGAMQWCVTVTTACQRTGKWLVQ